MWKLIDAFLTDIAEATGHARSSLSFTADLCGHGGPTVFPNPAANNVLKSVTAAPGASLPSGWYDSIGSNHLDYKVIHTEGKGEVKIPTTLYSFQHHPLAGCCRMGIQRWVRCNDSTWSEALQKKAFEFRRAVAKVHGCQILVVSSGPSGNNKTGELYEEFEELMTTSNGSKLYAMPTS